MSGEWIWVRDQVTGRLKQEVDKPDVCGKGHPGPRPRADFCPVCSQRATIFICDVAGCRWTAAGGRHTDYDCDPSLYDPDAGRYGITRQERARYRAADEARRRRQAESHG
jgi:hypothetical protein